jgi:calmodulin
MDNPGLRFHLPLIAEGGHIRFGHDNKKLWEPTQMTFNLVETLDAFVKNKVKRKHTIVTDWLTPEKAAKCCEGFRQFDKDGNSFLDREEFVAVLQATGRTYTKIEVQMAIDTITRTKGGTGLTFEQFAAVLQVKMTSDTQNRIRARSQLFDADNTGDISFEGLTDCLDGIDSLLTSSELTEMMRKYDTNGDGMISYEEFLIMVPTMISPTSLDVNQSLWGIMCPFEPSSAVVGGFGWGDAKKMAGVQVRVNEVRVN